MIDFHGKRILLIGFAGEGRASLRYISKHSPSCIGVADQSANLSISPEESALISRMHLGSSWLDSLDDYDIAIRSPGVPLHTVNARRTTPPRCVVTSGTNIFLEAHASRCIGITGTKGKSTTTSLIYRILKAAGVNVQLGGNIGIAALSLIESDAELFVLELSSYQLEDCTHSPHGAVFLNLYPEHLDHHGDFAHYGAAKATIARFQSGNDFLVTSSSQSAVNALVSSTSAQKITFGSPTETAWIENDRYHYRNHAGEVEQLCSVHATKLKGPGNRQNILAALCVASRFTIAQNVLAEVLTQFEPLPHRLEQIGSFNEVTYINDSISTVPEATINALETFGDAVKTLILGGYDRGVSFDALASYLLTSQVETLILFPPSGERIALALRSLGAFDPARIHIEFVNSMDQAVLQAHKRTPKGGICLLSPASPSFPIFKNFEERGAQFKAHVLSLRC